ncbi:MAG: hypothetical protein J0I54_20415 [Bosea sp.]|uniref:hypothetical protein n=1 Tax=unclassified Bosea (in: a-proteobacteria) TaxID=2653178 RepID=UPI000AD07490|nr:MULTISPECIES: hypothetical protein [unclassified Bosea (in: a-proteobacteria)]MBN9459003.1 hypothetical protein [Bosea sp. (in: a-proteobacteria)]
MTSPAEALPSQTSGAWEWRSRVKGGAWDAWEQGRFGQEIPPFADVQERWTGPATLAKSASEPAGGGDGWRDISTAPKDERVTFIACEGPFTYQCGWQVEDDGEGRRREGWYDFENQSFENPTLWQPFPKARDAALSAPASPSPAEAEAREDACLFGAGYLRVNADGSLDRIEPRSVKFKAPRAEAEALPTGGDAVASYPSRVAQACAVLFDGDPTDVAERRDRFAEEANEVCQAFGMTREEAHALVDYTYGRPVGEPGKEIGAAMTSLTSLANEAGYGLMECAEADLANLIRPETIARIRAKRATRHGRGPLPGLSTPAEAEARDSVARAIARGDGIELDWLPDQSSPRWQRYRKLADFALASLPTPKAGKMVCAADYVVWSNEHSAWWGPDEAGYRAKLEEAGRYDREQALAICAGARGGRQYNENPSEVPVLFEDAARFWPNDAPEWRSERWRRSMPADEEGA